jgi:hypothetical protein
LGLHDPGSNPGSPILTIKMTTKIYNKEETGKIKSYLESNHLIDDKRCALLGENKLYEIFGFEKMIFWEMENGKNSRVVGKKEEELKKLEKIIFENN